MLEIYNVEVHGLERSIKASGNPMTVGKIHTNVRDHNPSDVPTENDVKRSKTLGSTNSGEGHDNYLKGIIVQFDVKYPQYWTPEAQRYTWLNIVSSQSKMHRLTTAGSKEEFTSMFNKYVDDEVIKNVQEYILSYNNKQIKDGMNSQESQYYWFMKALSNLPMGYEMYETLTTNYLQLKTIINQRWNHKLDEWRYFCEEMLKLPMLKELIGFNKEIKRF
jgi:hypothetical protein